MSRVQITLDFENTDNPDSADVYNYLNELMENDCLHYEVIGSEEEEETICGWKRQDVVTCAQTMKITLDEEEVDEVFDRMEHRFDASLGMSWDIIEMHIDDVVSMRD
jgi:hypothetical protein